MHKFDYLSWGVDLILFDIDISILVTIEVKVKVCKTYRKMIYHTCLEGIILRFIGGNEKL